jgi:hypothetical protein
MRRVFAAIEAGQARLLGGAEVSYMDRRLSQWRRMALHLFEQKWAGAAKSGVSLDEKNLADLYLRCLTKVLQTNGVSVPADVLPSNPVVDRLLSEKT